MARSIPWDIINKIRAEADLVSIIEQTCNVRFPQRNGWVRCKCPFHHDDNPSFAVHRNRQVFNCFAATCSMNGRSKDVFNFFMEHPQYRLTFVEAVVHVSKIVGRYYLVEPFVD